MMIMAQHPHKRSQEGNASENNINSTVNHVNNSSNGNVSAVAAAATAAAKHNRELREKADRLVAELCAPQISRKTTTAITSNDTAAIKSGSATKKDKTTTSARLYTRPEFEDKLLKQQQQQQHQHPHQQKQQQQRYDQEGKRTLIKNQLCLIEQLQLENADLRNERDQLQLENEELKFQLQMISSSNILGQSDNAFGDDRQLVDNESNGGGGSHATASNCATTTEHTSQQHSIARPSSCIPAHSSHIATAAVAGPLSGNNHYGKPVITSSTSDLSGQRVTDATPLRYPMRPINDADGRRQRSQHAIDKEGQSKVKSSVSSLDCRIRIDDNNECESSTSIFSKALPASNQFTSAKSTLSSVVGEVKRSLVPLAQSISGNHNRLIATNQDEELMTGNMVRNQFYGDDEQANAAATVIQRAYRKYQICKRFRTITEQLRQACQQQSSPTSQQRERNQSRGPTVVIETKQNHQQTVAKNAHTNQVTVPFVSGSTRAAAWESLSQAASRLAASAASATIGTKQVFSNGVSKSASCQQVSSSPSSSSANNNFNKNPQTQTRISNKTPPTTTMVSSDRSSQFKSNSVVAAALNFQQLESIRKRQYRVGLNIFNKNPEQGVSYLVAHSFIDCTPPYSKSSTSYYLSNQLHFIDKQQLTAHQQSIISCLDMTVMKTKSDLQHQNCRMCHDEENLKRNVAHFLLHRKGLAKEKIGQYLGNLQSQFNQDVLHYYLQELDFNGFQVDVALRKFSSTMRMPGEAQKIERFVDCFAQRYVQCQQFQSLNEFSCSNNSDQAIYLSANGRQAGPDGITNWSAGGRLNDDQSVNNKNNLTLLSKDEIFILTFAIIMLNTDLHSPSLKSSSRMSASQFVNNLRGVFKSRTINESDLVEIYERVKVNQITTTPDHVTHVMKVQQGLTTNNFQKKELPNLCMPHRRLVCFCRLFEVYDVNKKERIGQHQREIFLFNDMLLVTKLSRRARTNTPQQYTYRQSISLQGLYVQLFQSTYYNFGIRLCQRANDETLIMFNARNELDQSRFVDDLNESIAEMDEMDAIRASNLIETLHCKHQDRLRRHAHLHSPEHSITRTVELDESLAIVLEESKTIEPFSEKSRSSGVGDDDDGDDDNSTGDKETTMVAVDNQQRMPSKFSSMSNLASVAEVHEEDGHQDVRPSNSLRPNRSFVQKIRQSSASQNNRRQQAMQREISKSRMGPHRSQSTNSIHSLDSGLFSSRDASPNQSG